jgi:CRP/FNR family cyclic AMP-dependent transcriptional regulator
MFATKTRIHPELATSELGIVTPVEELQTLDRMATAIPVPAGEDIMRAGEFGRECFIVIDGEFQVRRNDQTIIVGAGAVLGEMALLTLRPRSATVTATADSNVYVLNRAEFSSLLDACPSIAQHVLVGAARRAAT